MRKKILAICLGIFVFFSISLSIAQPANKVAVTEKPLFDIKSANKKFDTISIKLSIENLQIETLKAALAELQQLQTEAKACVEESKKQIEAIDELFKSTKEINSDQTSATSDYQYLQKKRSIYLQQFSDCRLFVFRSHEAITAYQETIQKLSTSKFFKKTTPLWKIIQNPSSIIIMKFDWNKFYQKTGVAEISLVELSILFILLIASTLLTISIRKKSKAWLTHTPDAPGLTAAITATMVRYIVPIIFFAVLTLCLKSSFYEVRPTPTAEFFSFAIFVYFSALALMRFALNPLAGASPLNLSRDLGEVFYKRFFYIATLLLLGYFLLLLFQGQEIPIELIEIIRTIYITVLSILLIWLCWPIERLKIFNKIKSWPILIRLVLSLTLIIIVTAEWIGYHQFSLFLISGVLSSILSFISLWLAIKINSAFFKVLKDNKYFLAQKIRYFFAIKPHRSIIELEIIKYVVNLILITLFILLVLKIWQASNVTIDKIYNGLTEGFKFLDIKLIPLNIIVLAPLIFCLINIIGKLYAGHVTRHRRLTSAEKDAQVAVASLITYISFTIALLLALLIAGLNFTGLAIIAGALSVGIGLGLQGIVNNFVSGILLLLERPIKPGDRIVIGNTEGFIKRVRLRSTQIQTMAREDVIVPNSQLITEQVTNFMFRDRHWRVACKVGVAYGSNVELVKSLLLEVAHKHPDILKEPPNEPSVLFKEFGESSLIFELWVIIQEVNKKYVVASDLHFAIAKIFRENKIVIPFPQRDLHIKDWQPPKESPE